MTCLSPITHCKVINIQKAVRFWPTLHSTNVTNLPNESNGIKIPDAGRLFWTTKAIQFQLLALLF